MSKGYDNIKDITDKKEIWKLAVKVDDIWTVVKSNQELAEMIICDVKVNLDFRPLIRINKEICFVNYVFFF
jgi:hypothetical protein